MGRLLYSCSAQASHLSGFSRGTQALGPAGSAAVACWLQSSGSVAVAHWLSCPMACGIFLDQGLNPCLLHWQADSLSVSHQGSPAPSFILLFVVVVKVLFRNIHLPLPYPGERKNKVLVHAWACREDPCGTEIYLIC